MSCFLRFRWGVGAAGIVVLLAAGVPASGSDVKCSERASSAEIAEYVFQASDVSKDWSHASACTEHTVTECDPPSCDPCVVPECDPFKAVGSRMLRIWTYPDMSFEWHQWHWDGHAFVDSASIPQRWLDCFVSGSEGSGAFVEFVLMNGEKKAIGSKRPWCKPLVFESQFSPKDFPTMKKPIRNIRINEVK